MSGSTDGAPAPSPETRSRRPRVACAAAGALFIALAIAGDALGLGPAGFGRDQWLLALFGLLLVLVAALGRRIVQLHRATALIVLNSLLLLLLVELGAAAYFRVGDLLSGAASQDWRDHAWDGVSTDVAYYDEQAWSAGMWRDYKRAWFGLRYHPYVLWRKAPFASETINVDAEGLRVTPEASCGDGGYRVLVFGGSTAWGFGSPDWGTLPAYLQQLLADERNGPVCVVNFGEGGYVSTQELIALQRELQGGSVPDLALFYDGWNDVLNALYSDRPDGHFHLATLAAQLEGREPFDLIGSFRRGEVGNPHFVINTPPHLELDWVRGSYTYALLQRTLLPGLQTERGMVRHFGEPQRIVAATLDVYLANVEAIGALAGRHGFDHHVFWQPHITQGDKPLTPSEREIADQARADGHGLEVYRRIYRSIAETAAGRAHLHYLGEVFDDVTEQLYIDEGHVIPRGNEILAERIGAVLREAGAAAGGPDSPRRLSRATEVD